MTEPPAVLPPKQKVVFVVDDETVIAATLATILKNAGFEAHAFFSGQEAVDSLNKLQPDLLGRETRVDKCFTDIDCASDTEFVRKRSHNPRDHAEPNPLLKSPMTGLIRGVSVGEVGPRCASP